MRLASLAGAVALCAAAPLAAQQSAQQPAAASDDAFVLPPYAGDYEPVDEDERGLWQQLDEFELRLQHSADRISDPALNRYVQAVLCQAVGDERCNAARIYIVRDTAFNASMAPNGMMLVNSGLLLRLRSEAELASVLGHEFGHFENRHSLLAFKKARSSTDLIAWFSAVAGGLVASLVVVSDFTRFNRDQEREADLIASAYLYRSHYPSKASASIWVRMIDEDAARADYRRRDREDRTAGWLDSHPSIYERAEYLTQVSQNYADEGYQGVEEYAAALDPFRFQFFEDQLRRNDFAASLYILEEMASDGWTADLLVMRGELYRTRGTPEDLALARDDYQGAIDQGTTRPEAWRGLGMAQLRLRETDAGRAALREYLQRKPDAADAAMMRLMAGV